MASYGTVVWLPSIALVANGTRLIWRENQCKLWKEHEKTEARLKNFHDVETIFKEAKFIEDFFWHGRLIQWSKHAFHFEVFPGRITVTYSDCCLNYKRLINNRILLSTIVVYIERKWDIYRSVLRPAPYFSSSLESRHMLWLTWGIKYEEKKQIEQGVSAFGLWRAYVNRAARWRASFVHRSHRTVMRTPRS